MPLGDVPLRHGYTLADANRLSMVTLRQTWGQQRLGGPDRPEVAWFAIIEHLYAVLLSRFPKISPAGDAVRHDTFLLRGYDILPVTVADSGCPAC